MSNVQAAIGYAKMQKIEKLIARLKEILNFYRNNLESRPDVIMNIERQGIKMVVGCQHSFFLLRNVISVNFY